MQKTLAKGQITDLAQQAVSSIRRFISSGHNSMTLTQQDLISTSKLIEDVWQKKRLAVNASVMELWVTSFQEEIAFQLEFGCDNTVNNGKYHSSEDEGDVSISKGKSSREPNQKRKFIGESVMLTCMDVLKILFRSNKGKLTEILIQYHLARHMTKYFALVPLSKRVRDAFSAVLLDIIGYNTSLLEESFLASCGLLVRCEDHNSACIVLPQQVHLACVLTAALRRADVNGIPANNVRVCCGQKGFLSSLIRTSSILAGEAIDGMNEGLQFTACLAYFGLVNAMVCGCAENKALCRSQHREELATLCVHASSNVYKAELMMSIPTNVPGKDALIAVENAQTWASELVDFLVEVTTSDSFSIRRQALYDDSMICSTHVGGESAFRGSFPFAAFTSTVFPTNGGGDMLSSVPSPLQSPSPVSSSGITRVSRRYEPIPPHWDTILTGGSTPVWHLASLLFNCVLFSDGCSFIAEVLLRIDTHNNYSEFVYRSVICTLMLLCVATPRNSEVLSESPIIEALTALITYPHDSVFSSGVLIMGKVCTPTHVLNAHAIQLSVTFMGLLTSLHISEGTLPKLLHGVEKMCLRQTVQTDADIIESFLHVISCTGFPRSVLFFPGTGSVICKVDRLSTPRFCSYSFATWLLPKCVWQDGSHLFSYTDTSSGSSVVLMVVADGRFCSLILRICHATEITLSRIPDSLFQADVWSHVAFTHTLSGFHVFINGRQTSNVLSAPLPKASSKKDRLQFALGGSHGEPSFFGFVACMELFGNTLSEKDVQMMYQAGPRPSRELSMSCHPLLCVESKTAAGTTLPNVGVTGSFAGRHEGVSVQNVLAFNPPNAPDSFAREDVPNWALRTIAKAKDSPSSFPLVARLCVQFICTTMKLTMTGEELNRMLDADVIPRLKEELLSWDSIPIEVPSLLISCTIPRNGGKVMRTHPTTQTILLLLLDIIDRRSASPVVISCILRELSDTLLLPENAALFRAVPGRFKQILDMGPQLPVECIENFIILMERLCKEPYEMEQTLVFLLSEPVSKTCDLVKTEVLHMLFDIARTNAAMCDLIGGAFGNSGASFLIRLVGGKNHTSETIRVFSLRIISLMLHSNKKFREVFVKSHGYEVLASVMTNSSSSSVPIRLSTFNCLFQMAFDVFQSTPEDAVPSHQEQACSPKGRKRVSKFQDPNTLPKRAVGQTMGLQGYLPGVVSHRLRVFRREYSFDVSQDFSHNNDSRLLDDMHRGSRSRGSGSNVLQEPEAIHTLLCLLQHLLCTANWTSTFSPIGGREIGVYHENGWASPVLSEEKAAWNADSASTTSVASLTQEEPPETVALRVLNYLEKIVDRQENGEALLPFPWLTWLWDAVGHVFGLTNGIGWDNPSKISRRFVLGIQQRVRNIVQSLAILDLRRNSKAGVVRLICQTQQPTQLARLVLDCIVAHFSKNKCEINDQNEASNIIKNMDTLLQNIDEILNPLPLGLGLEILNSISAIAVNNNSWVRMRMKNSSRLFETRSRLSFQLLATTRRFSKLEPTMLAQLLEVNEHEPNAIPALLRRLLTSISNCDPDEVEILMMIIRQLVESDQNHYQALHTVVGPEYRTFVELLSGGATGGCGTSLHSERGPGSSLLSSGRNEESVTSKGVPTSELIQWCLEDATRWEVIRQHVKSASKFMSAFYEDDNHKTKEKNQSSKAKRIDGRTQNIQNRIAVEVERITKGVDINLSRETKNSSLSNTIGN